MLGGQPSPGYYLYDPFEVGYKDAYANPIVRINVYNKQNQTTTTYEMYDVFPMNIQAMNLSWADENELQKLTITFAYTNMRVTAPRGSMAQAPASESIAIQLPALLEKVQLPDFSRGLAAADAAPSPTNESITRTVGASTPNATEPVQPPPISPDLPGIPTVRDFTSP
jgi:hypothetical protein